VDREIEDSLRKTLTRLVPCAFAGEETEPSADADEVWLVDPHDGPHQFRSGTLGEAGRMSTTFSWMLRTPM